MDEEATRHAGTAIARPRRAPRALAIPEAKIEPIRSGRRRIVARPRLFESLSSAVASRRLTLIAAPPGAGKSTLLSSWLDAGAAPARTAWVTIDESDNRPERFWQAVVVALDRAGWEGVAQLAKAAAAISSKTAPREFPALLGEAMADGDELSVLVLDDFQEVSDERVLAGISQLLKVAPPGFRLVVASRRDPPLPLHRLRLAGQLAEIRAEPLAFTSAEARRLLAGQGLVLSNADVESLVARTEGWAGALTLASLALRETDDPSRIIRDFAGDDRAVADYLASEVLDALPDRLSDFLVRTSVSTKSAASSSTPSSETDGGGDVLADLERRNCFVIALDTRRKWYRYHRLFLELLRSRLAARPRREREELHSRAARWHADNDRPVDAIRHAIAAQEWRFAVDLAGERWLDVVLAGRGPALRPLLSRLPEELIEREPAIAVAFAGIQLELGGAPARVDAYLDLARDALDRGPADPAVAELHAVVSLQRARSRDDRTLADRATEMLGDIRFAEDAACYPERRALVLLLLGACESLWTGLTTDGSRHLRAGIALARRSEQDYSCSAASGNLAALSAAEGSLRVGADLALEAVSLAESREWLGLPRAAPALLALGWAEHLWCDSARPPRSRGRPRARGRRATSPCGCRSPRSRPSRSWNRAMARAARSRRCAGRCDESATGGRRRRWNTCCAASRRGSCSRPPARRRGSRGRGNPACVRGARGHRSARGARARRPGHGARRRSSPYSSTARPTKRSRDPDRGARARRGRPPRAARSRGRGSLARARARARRRRPLPLGLPAGRLAAA